MNFGYADEQVYQLESNFECLTEQEKKLDEAHSQLLHSMLGRDLSQSASPGIFTLRSSNGERLRACDVAVVKTHLNLLETELNHEKIAKKLRNTKKQPKKKTINCNLSSKT